MPRGKKNISVALQNDALMYSAIINSENYHWLTAKQTMVWLFGEECSLATLSNYVAEKGIRRVKNAFNKYVYSKEDVIKIHNEVNSNFFENKQEEKRGRALRNQRQGKLKETEIGAPDSHFSLPEIETKK